MVKKILKKNNKSSKSSKSKKKDYDYKDKFIYDARLTKLQRKYCSCINKVRSNLPDKNKSAVYPICYTSIKNKYIKDELGDVISVKSNNSSKSKRNQGNKNSISKKVSKKIKLSKKYKKIEEEFQKRLNTSRTNCLMNYDFRRLSDKEVEDMAKEKGIKLTYNKNGKTVKYQKPVLVRSLKDKYFKRIKKLKSNK